MTGNIMDDVQYCTSYILCRQSASEGGSSQVSIVSDARAGTMSRLAAVLVSRLCPQAPREWIPPDAGLILGILGMLVFSLTMPMTKIALAADAMSAWFAWSGRAVLAAFAGLAYLVAIRARRPPREALWPLAGTTAGVVFGWPLLNTIALQSVPAGHAAVINGILPLATAVIGASLNPRRLSRRFWLCAVGSTITVCAYAWQRASGHCTSPTP